MLVEVQIFLEDQKKVRGSIDFLPHYLEIKDIENTESWDYADIEWTIGGAADKLIFFSNKKSKRISSLYFERSKNNLNAIKTSGSPYLTGIVKRSQQTSLKTYSSLSLAGLLLLLFVALISLLWSPTISFIAESIPYGVEQELGNRIVGLVVPEGKRISHPELQEQLESELGRLIIQLPKPMRDIQVYMTQDGDINAFALPGGHIIFNRGLLEKAQSIEEVLGVAAHELAHVQKRHALKNLIQSVGIFLGVDLMMGDISGLIAVIADNSQILLQRGFSRDFEMESDNLAFETLIKAEVSPRGLLDFFETLKSQSSENEGLEKHLAFLSTHPGTDERIENLNQKIDAVRRLPAPINFDYEHFKQLLRDHITK